MEKVKGRRAKRDVKEGETLRDVRGPGRGNGGRKLRHKLRFTTTLAESVKELCLPVNEMCLRPYIYMSSGWRV